MYSFQRLAISLAVVALVMSVLIMLLNFMTKATDKSVAAESIAEVSTTQDVSDYQTSVVVDETSVEESTVAETSQDTAATVVDETSVEESTVAETSQDTAATEQADNSTYRILLIAGWIFIVGVFFFIHSR